MICLIIHTENYKGIYKYSDYYDSACKLLIFINFIALSKRSKFGSLKNYYFFICDFENENELIN